MMKDGAKVQFPGNESGNAMLMAVAAVGVLTMIGYSLLNNLTPPDNDFDEFLVYSTFKIINTNVFTIMGTVQSGIDTVNGNMGLNASSVNTNTSPTSSPSTYKGLNCFISNDCTGNKAPALGLQQAVGPPYWPSGMINAPAYGAQNGTPEIALYYHQDGSTTNVVTYYDPNVATSGFTINGVPCSTFGPSQTNLDLCSIRLELSWYAHCLSVGGATCENDNVNIIPITHYWTYIPHLNLNALQTDSAVTM